DEVVDPVGDGSGGALGVGADEAGDDGDRGRLSGPGRSAVGEDDDHVRRLGQAHRVVDASSHVGPTAAGDLLDGTEAGEAGHRVDSGVDVDGEQFGAADVQAPGDRHDLVGGDGQFPVAHRAGGVADARHPQARLGPARVDHLLAADGDVVAA